MSGGREDKCSRVAVHLTHSLISLRIPSPIPLGFHYRQHKYISLDRTLQTYKTLHSESFTILKSVSTAKYRVFKTTRKVVLKIFQKSSVLAKICNYFIKSCSVKKPAVGTPSGGKLSGSGFEVQINT